jgi:putative membrane protein
MCGLFSFGHAGFFGGMSMFLLWAVVIGLILWGATRMGRHALHTRYTPYGGNALEIARERYAKGEISKDEFDRLKKDLSC